VYKPLLITQSKQIDESKVTNNKLDEKRAELTNILQQLVTNGDLTTIASNNIVNKLNKLDNGVLTKILNAVSKKPEAIALINTLSKYPKVVNVIKYGDITGLNSNELKISDSLNVLDDNTWKVLVEYYSNIERESGNLFDYRSELTPDIPEDDEIPAATKIDTAYSDSGIGTSSNITGAEWGINNAAISRENEQLELAAFKIKSNLIYTLVNLEDTKRNEQAIYKYLNDDNPYEYVNRNNVTVAKNASGTKLLLNYLISHNITPDKRSYPWIIIKNKTNFFNELDTAKRHAATTGTGVKFLSSDPKVIMNKLKILLAEKKAGNNNVFNEISAISQELRRSGVLSLKQLKSLYKNLH